MSQPSNADLGRFALRALAIFAFLAAFLLLMMSVKG
jgi:hypothetical protein